MALFRKQIHHTILTSLQSICEDDDSTVCASNVSQQKRQEIEEKAKRDAKRDAKRKPELESKLAAGAAAVVRLINDAPQLDHDIITYMLKENRVVGLRFYIQGAFVASGTRAGHVPTVPDNVTVDSGDFSVHQQAFEVQNYLMDLKEHGSELYERVVKTLKEQSDAKTDEEILDTEIYPTIRQTKSNTSSVTLSSVGENAAGPSDASAD